MRDVCSSACSLKGNGPANTWHPPDAEKTPSTSPASSTSSPSKRKWSFKRLTFGHKRASTTDINKDSTSSAAHAPHNVRLLNYGQIASSSHVAQSTSNLHYFSGAPSLLSDPPLHPNTDDHPDAAWPHNTALTSQSTSNLDHIAHARARADSMTSSRPQPQQQVPARDYKSVFESRLAQINRTYSNAPHDVSVASSRADSFKSANHDASFANNGSDVTSAHWSHDVTRDRSFSERSSSSSATGSRTTDDSNVRSGAQVPEPQKPVTQQRYASPIKASPSPLLPLTRLPSTPEDALPKDATKRHLQELRVRNSPKEHVATRQPMVARKAELGGSGSVFRFDEASTRNPLSFSGESSPASVPVLRSRAHAAPLMSTPPQLTPPKRLNPAPKLQSRASPRNSDAVVDESKWDVVNTPSSGYMYIVRQKPCYNTSTQTEGSQTDDVTATAPVSVTSPSPGKEERGIQARPGSIVAASLQSASTPLLDDVSATKRSVATGADAEVTSSRSSECWLGEDDLAKMNENPEQSAMLRKLSQEYFTSHRHLQSRPHLAGARNPNRLSGSHLEYFSRRDVIGEMEAEASRRGDKQTMRSGEWATAGVSHAHSLSDAAVRSSRTSSEASDMLSTRKVLAPHAVTSATHDHALRHAALKRTTSEQLRPASDTSDEQVRSPLQQQTSLDSTSSSGAIHSPQRSDSYLHQLDNSDVTRMMTRQTSDPDSAFTRSGSYNAPASSDSTRRAPMLSNTRSSSSGSRSDDVTRHRLSTGSAGSGGSESDLKRIQAQAVRSFYESRSGKRLSGGSLDTTQTYVNLPEPQLPPSHLQKKPLQPQQLVLDVQSRRSTGSSGGSGYESLRSNVDRSDLSLDLTSTRLTSSTGVQHSHTSSGVTTASSMSPRPDLNSPPLHPWPADVISTATDDVTTVSTAQKSPKVGVCEESLLK